MVKVLVTGATGFIGAHVLEALLKQGYSVRATARSQKKADFALLKYNQYKGKLKFVIVEDISKPNAFAGHLDGLDGIFHVASPVIFKVKSNVDELLNPAINGVLGILSEAAKMSSIKRIVLTSSFACMLDFSKGPAHVYTEEDWNPVTFEEAAETKIGEIAYMASKTLGEKAAFDFVKNNKPHFDIVTLCPAMVYGPFVHQVEKLSELGESARLFYEKIEGKGEKDEFDGRPYVDVRDLANAHVLAFEQPRASNLRFIIANGNYSWPELVKYAHKHFPNQTKAKVAEGYEEVAKTKQDNTKSKSVLGLSYRPLEETYHDTIVQLIEFKN